MSTENIDIVVTERGSKDASDNIRGVGDASDKTANQVDGLTTAMRAVTAVFAAIGVGKLISEYQQLADTFTGLQNRLKLVTTNGADLAATQQKLLDVANNTRASFEETSNFYTKLALQSAQLGLNSKDLIPAITTINQLIAISGTSATEAKAGLLQFSQGLVSNKFAGDELRSVLENIPALGQAIAKGLGTTTAGLRKMGADGQLSAKLVLDALQKSAPEIAKQFASITPTIGQAFQVLKNNLLSLVGSFDQAQGISAVFARAILNVAGHLDTIVRSVKTAIEVTIAFYVALQIQAGWNAFAAGVTAAYIRLNTYVAAAAAAGIETTVLSRAMVAFQTPIAAVTNAFRALWAVMLANPLVALIVIIGAIVALIYNFGDAIKLNASGSINLLGAVVGSFNYLWTLMQQFGSWLAGTWVGTVWKLFMDTLKAGWDLLVQFGTWLLDFLGKIIPSFAGATSAIKGWTAGLVKAMEDASKATSTVKDFKNTLDQGAGSADAMKKSMNGFDDSVNVSEADMKRFSLTTRNAFGEMVVASDEWARRSGANFNKVASAASSASSSISQAENSISGGGGSGGETSGSRSIGTPGVGGTQDTTSSGLGSFNPKEEVARVFEALGGSKDQFELLYRDLIAFQPGTAQGGMTLVLLFKDLQKTKPPEAAKSFVANYPYINTYLQSSGLPTFADGGGFTVGGSGGVDSQLVQFLASPDEEVTIANKNQQRKGYRGDSRNNGGTVVYMTVKTPDTAGFRRSNQQILLGLRSKLNQVG